MQCKFSYVCWDFKSKIAIKLCGCIHGPIKNWNSSKFKYRILKYPQSDRDLVLLMQPETPNLVFLSNHLWFVFQQQLNFLKWREKSPQKKLPASEQNPQISVASLAAKSQAKTSWIKWTSNCCLNLSFLFDFDVVTLFHFRNASFCFCSSFFFCSQFLAFNWQKTENCTVIALWKVRLAKFLSFAGKYVQFSGWD